ncbi:MAG: acetate--CoA ligase family protein [Betaproteobacteria bacterium]|nr:acetate--CoA ligase family protein [Betaproteobacteria bacterium]
MGRFAELFSPRSIAVVGVSDDPVRPGSQAVRALQENGYPGAIYPVNPKYATFRGFKCHAALGAIDGDIDVAVIGIPSRGVRAVIEECVARKVKYAVILSGGFRETGADGAALQDEIVALARAGGMRIIGPNCLGLANISGNVYAAFGSITRPPKLRPGPVSLVTQSGGFGYSIALACAGGGIGFRNIVATGNEADVDAVELIDGLLEDDGTEIVLAYIEGVKDGRALLEAGRRALSAGKPLLVWKSGITEQGARAAASHTANMTGSYEFYRALFKQAGIIELREIHEAVDYVKALRAGKFPQGRRVAVMGGSGGSAIVFTDAAEQKGLRLAAFGSGTVNRLATVVPAIGSVSNPVDFTAGYIAAEGAEKFGVAVRAVLDDPNVDAVCVNFATIAGNPAHAGARALAEIAPTTGKPVVVFLSVPRTEAGEAWAVLDAARIPVFVSPVRAAKAIAMLEACRAAREKNRLVTPAAAGHEARAVSFPAETPVLSEVQSKMILSALGITVSRDHLVPVGGSFTKELPDAPLAVKIVSPDIPHKTDIGAVRLDVRGRPELERAIEEVLAAARAQADGARIDGVLVSEMVTDGFELLIGAVNDAIFGPVIVLSAGGIHAEVLGDRTCRLAPFDRETAREMIGELRCSALFCGLRGKPPLDVEALADALSILSRFAWRQRDAVREIDINPLFLRPRGQGVVAADALIVRGSCHARADGHPM